MRQLLLLLMLVSLTLAKSKPRGSCSFVKASFCKLEHVCKSQSLHDICCECHDICLPCGPDDDDGGSCTDSDGQTRANGERWVEDNCKHFVCENGVARLIRDDSIHCVVPPNAYYCKRTREDGECCYSYNCNLVIPHSSCRDAQGNIRPNGTVWTDPENPCIQYTCHNGFIRTTHIRCPPLPITCTPVQVPGQCCPDCEPVDDQSCLDRNGVSREHGTSWQYPDQPCLIHTCDNGQIVTTPVDCPPRPTTGECLEVAGDSCCPTYNCFCVDEEGTLRPNGSEWISADNPCQINHCLDGVIQQRIIPCEPPPFGQTCTELPKPPNVCCPEYECERPCRDRNGVLRNHGEKWKYPGEPCVLYKCHDAQIFNTVIDCPRPPLNCRPGPPDGTCCPPPVCVGRDCIDAQGNTRPHGTSWTNPNNPCERHTCNNGRITSLIQDCARPPPGCTIIPGTCCQYQCTQRSCDFQGSIYSHGEEFEDNERNPCRFYRCNDGTVESRRPPIECEPLPPDCQNVQRPEGQCCSECVDDTGGGSSQTLEELRSFVRAQFSVLVQVLRIDASGVRQVNLLLVQIGDTIDQIIEETIEQTRGIITLLRLFIRLIIILLQDDLPDPTTDNIEELLTTFDSLGQRLIRRTFTELGRPSEDIQTTISRFRVLIRWIRDFPGQNPLQGIIDILLDVAQIFVAAYDLEGCFDDDGLYREVGSLYPNSLDNPTTCKMCRPGDPAQSIDVLNTTEHCPPIPVGCGSRFAPNRCCPDPVCDDDVCVFGGVNYNHGEFWPNDPIRPCITYNCTEGRILEVNRTHCRQTPPGCSNWYMDGVCCPKFDCDENPCRFNGELIDHGVSKPIDPRRPCQIVTCNNGVLTTEDVSLDCPGPPHDFCRSRLVPYQCCPAYDCVTVNCTFDGVVYTEGQLWYDDNQYPCKQYNCTKNGTVKVQDLSVDCPPRPHPLCVGERIVGECCKTWDCPNLDCEHNGQTFPNGAQWWDNPLRRCRLHACRSGVVILLTDLLPCLTVPERCQPNYRNNECCHYKYTCPQCMFDPTGNLIPML